MTEQGYRQLKQDLDEMKVELGLLGECSKEINARIENGYFVPDTMAEELESAIRRYREKAALLQRTASEISFSIEDGSVSGLDAAIEAGENDLRLDALREIVRDYFRLTAEAEAVRSALEDAKALLKAKCQEDTDDSGLLLEPYRIVVESAKNPDVMMSDPDYDLVEIVFGRDIARAAERGKLTYDPNADISAYLDDSCGLLRSEVKESLPDAPIESKTSGQTAAQPETCVEYEQIELTDAVDDEKPEFEAYTEEARDEIADESDTDDTETEPFTEDEQGEIMDETDDDEETSENPEVPTELSFLDDYDGYVDDVAVEYTDVKEKASASKLKSLANHTPGLLKALLYTARQKLLAMGEAQNQSEDYYRPSERVLSALKKDGYLIDINFDIWGEKKHFLTPSSMAWACLAKPEIISYIKSKDKSLQLSRQEYSDLSRLSSAAAVRAGMMLDFFTAKSSPVAHHVMEYSGVSFEFAASSGIFCIAAVFEKEKASEGVSIIRQQIWSLNENENQGFKLVIITKSREDIRRLCDVMALGDEYYESVQFCVAPDYTVMLDHNGNEIFDDTGSDLEPVQDSMPWSEPEPTTAPKPVPESAAEPTPKPAPEPMTEPTPASMPKPVTEVRAVKDELTPEQGRNFDAVYDEMLRAGKLYCATAYLKALSNRFQHYETEYERLAYAVNDPMLHTSYSSDRVFSVYYSSSEVPNEYLVLSAALRNYFYNQSSFDYGIPQLQSTISGMQILSNNIALNRIAYRLSRYKSEHKKGMDVYADYRLRSAVNAEARILKLCNEAKELYAGIIESKSRETASFKRFLETQKLIFSKDGDLACCLRYVVEDQRSEYELIRGILSNSFITEGMPASAENIDHQKLDDFIQMNWIEAEKSMMVKKNNATLIGSRYNNLYQKIKRILTLLCDYVCAVGETQTNESEPAYVEYKRGLDGLLQDIDDAITQLEDDSTPEKHVLTATLRELREKLDGTYPEGQNRYFYLNFLRNSQVYLNSEFLPVLDEVKGLKVLSPIERICAHFLEPELDFRTRLEEIYGGSDDYGTAGLILRWLKLYPDEVPEWETYAEQYEEAAKQPLAYVSDRQNSFIADIEMAQSQGQIDNTEGYYKDAVLETVDHWRELLEESENYGFFYRILEEFQRQIRENAKVRAADMNDSMNAYLAKNPKWNEDENTAAVIQRIQTRIENQNYTSAEDLLNRLIAGDTELDSEIIPTDYLTEFLQEYDSLNMRVGNAQKPIQTLLHIHGVNKDTRGSERLIDSWPSGNGVSAERVKTLFTMLGFPVAEVKKLDNINKKDHFTVRLSRPANGRKANYKHPIYVFGSEAERDELRVICIFGKMDAERLIETYKDIGNAKNTIVLLDYALTIPDRRMLARKVKAQYAGRSFAVIDRIALAYLAKHYSETDINRRLMAIIMPYSAFQPYIAESSKVMPPEIFMGRNADLEKIESANGVNIVYGGRQLGKSALLKMAQKDIDWDENGDRAILVDIKYKRYPEAAEKVSAALSDERFFLTEFITKDWGELARAIKNRLRDEAHPIPYFLLLLDEADAFIESCGEIKFAPFDDLKDIQSIGSGRFKFVVAGLRNVVRFNRDKALSNNVVLTQLASHTVKPFSYTEARELIELPLYYLGFRFPDDEKTNSLISNICGTTNYFPGLIQLYCAKLIEAMKQDYAGYSEADTPPYYVREDHIKRVLADESLAKQIKEKFDITLKVDEDYFYYIIALLGAFLYHSSGSNSFSAASIRSTAEDYNISKISSLNNEQVDALMQEMCELNVLQDTGDSTYRFSRYSFYQMMGTVTDIEEDILKYGIEGEV